jgi:hypothetical protein
MEIARMSFYLSSLYFLNIRRTRTIGLSCSNSSVMHKMLKPLSLSVIVYLLSVASTGSMIAYASNGAVKSK